MGQRGYIHDKAMADAAARAHAALHADHLAHQFVRMQATLHERFGLTDADQFNGFGGSGMAVRNVNNRYSADIQAATLGQCTNLDCRPDQRRGNDLQSRRFDCALEGRLITGMCHGCRCRRQRAALFNETLELVESGHLVHVGESPRTGDDSTCRLAEIEFAAGH
jgi:hypothetical protein